MQKISNSFFFLILLLLNASIAYGNDPSTELLEKLSTIKTLQADFSQESYDAKNKLLQKQSGNFKVKQSGEFIWSIAAPYEQKIISDAKSLKIYDPDLEQLTIKAIDNKVQVIPLLLFSGKNEQINEQYLVTNPSPNHYLLTSKNKNSLFVSLEVVFMGDKPDALIITDSLKQQTIVKFIATAINKTLPENLFIFAVPTGVDIIDESRVDER